MRGPSFCAPTGGGAGEPLAATKSNPEQCEINMKHGHFRIGNQSATAAGLLFVILGFWKLDIRPELDTPFALNLAQVTIYLTLGIWSLVHGMRRDVSRNSLPKAQPATRVLLVIGLPLAIGLGFFLLD